MTDVRPIETIFFDVGATLARPEPSVAEVCRQVLLGAGHERDIATIERYMPLVDEYYERRYSEDDGFWTEEEATAGVWVGMYSVLMNALEIPGDVSELAWRVYQEFGDPGRWALYDDVLPALKRLRAQGIPIGIISNWDTRLTRVLTGLGVTEYTDCVISSAAVGLHKPDPRIFELACSEMGVRPQHAAHVGDHHYADFFGATSCGMRAVLIERGESVTDLEPSIRSLDHLETALGI